MSDSEEGKRKHGDSCDDGVDNGADNKRPAIGGAGDNETVTTIKLLCTNKAVGQVIGKGGAMISRIKETSGAQVKISSSSEVYPGSSNLRIIVVTGSINSVLSAAQLIVAELATQTESPDGEMVLTIALPSSACGLVIGKGGERINILREQCKCKMQMQAKDQAVRGIQERTMTVTGALHNVQTAVEKVILLLSEDGTVHYENTSTNYGGAGKAFHGGNPSQFHDGVHHGAHSGILGEVAAISVTIRLAIPENTVGNLVGKGGSTIKELISICGCQIKVSQKGDVVPGTTKRIVTISGNAMTAACAQALVLQRVPEAQIIQ